MEHRSRALMTDLYELTMAAGYFENDVRHTASFAMFVRDLPPCRNYLLAAGLAQALEYLTDLRFTGNEIDFLRRHPSFKHVSGAFFDYLAGFRFTGDLWALPEGTPFFADEPVVLVTGPIIEAQLVETYLLSIINYQTSIATKASRVVQAAGPRPVIEFGARRAHGMDSALYGARAAFIGGCAGTSNVEAGYTFGIPLFGTAAHSWTMAFNTEAESFRAYLRVFPESTTLLVDTYDTLAAAREATTLDGRILGVRLDSGDIVEMSKQVRSILDEAGLTDTKIVASSDLDEYRIARLVSSGAPIDIFGVGTQMSVSYDAPTLSGVYKLVEQVVAGHVQYKMKLSAEKATYPGRKQVWRRTDAAGQYEHDTIALMDEGPVQGSTPLLRQYIRGGRLCAQYPSLEEIRQQAGQSLQRLPECIRRIEEPEKYEVRISPALVLLRQQVLSALGAGSTT